MKQKTKLLVFKYTWDDVDDAFRIGQFSKEHLGDNHIVHDEIEVELEFNTLDEQQVKLQVIEGLKRKKEKALAEAQGIAADCDEKIQQLMALEAPE